MTADPNSATPTASQGPEVIYEQETDGYTEWDGTADIVPGVYVADPTGEADAKPGDLFGHSAYFKDGAWYVFDPSQGLPEYVKDVYLAPTSTPDPSFTDQDTAAKIAAHDLEICYIILMSNSKGYYTFGNEWVGRGEGEQGTNNIIIEGGFDDFKTHGSAEDTVSAMISMLEARGNCRNSEIPIMYGYQPK